MTVRLIIDPAAWQAGAGDIAETIANAINKGSGRGVIHDADGEIIGTWEVTE